MGLTYMDATVRGPSGGERQIRLLVDSGASYTILPEEVWRELGLEAKRTETVVLADGTELEREVSECHIALAGRDGHTPVILGEPGDQAVLGVVTLENLGLILDPFKRTLRAMQTRLG